MLNMHIVLIPHTPTVSLVAWTCKWAAYQFPEASEVQGILGDNPQPEAHEFFFQRCFLYQLIISPI